jgi:asparagine synthase (glutamine-hydrolysing)
MCGIAGFIGSNNLESAADSAAVLRRMCDVIKHRGPDDWGTHVANNVALGMRRLAIIDLVGGHQPMSSSDGNFTIVFNGEIYNYQELRAALMSRGHRFSTDSDTETILVAYEEHGEECLQYLRGMFAFAIWDERKRSLFIARDRVGKKPLYYSLTLGGDLVFGSEIKSLLKHPGVRRDVSVTALDAYLTLGYVPEPLSIFAAIEKLPPGSFLTFAAATVKVKPYWDLKLEPQDTTSEKEYVEQLRHLLNESVRLRLISDVPLGAFLSGGIDSSAVVAFMARNMGQPVKTFSIGFNEDTYSELKFARLTAQKFGTDHHEFIVTPAICDVVDEFIWHFDEPFADPSAIPTYMVSKLAREHVTVVLSGDGGDELFGGYTRYAEERKRNRFSALPEVVRKGIMQPLSRNLPHGVRGRNYLYNVSLDTVGRYLDSVSVFTSLNKTLLYTSDFISSINGGGSVDQMFRALAAKVSTNDFLDTLLYIDTKTYLPGDILSKVDRMSMAVSLEARAPLLDHKLIELVGRVPANLKMRGLEGKYIFKKAVEDLVPAEILNRPKQGFGMPLQEWINEQLRDRIRETLTDRVASQRGIVNQSYVRVLLDEHDRRRRDHSTQLWALMMLELWYRKYVDTSECEKSNTECSPALAS